MALQQLAASLGSRLLQQSARSQGFSQLSISLLPGQQHLQLARGCALSQQRALVTIDVVNNQVDRALKTLKRKVVEEGLPKQWKAHEFHVKPSEQRKLDAAETEKRLRKRAFREKIRWILKRKARGF